MGSQDSPRWPLGDQGVAGVQDASLVENVEADANTFDEGGFAEQADDFDGDDGNAVSCSERLERQAKDRDLVEQLRAVGFTGPRYEALAADLAAYGLAVMQAWIQRRVIYHKSAQFGRPVRCPEAVREHLTTHTNDRNELALEIVAHALVSFRNRALVRGAWSSQGGAALRTFFVGACVAEFANVFRNWLREYTMARAARPCGLGGERDEHSGINPIDGAVDDPSTIVIRNQWLNQELSMIKNKNLRYALHAITFRAATYGEIAEELGLTEPAVKMMVSRYRRERRRRQHDRGTP